MINKIRAFSVLPPGLEDKKNNVKEKSIDFAGKVAKNFMDFSKKMKDTVFSKEYRSDTTEKVANCLSTILPKAEKAISKLKGRVTKATTKLLDKPIVKRIIASMQRAIDGIAKMQGSINTTIGALRGKVRLVPLANHPESSHVESDVSQFGEELSIIKKKSGDSEETYTIIRPAPPIKKLVFQGGGAKGVGYPECLQALVDGKAIKLEKIDEVSGTSAGAIIAYLLACGLNPEEISDELDKLKMTELLGQAKNGNQDTDINLKAHSSIFKAERLPEVLHEITNKKVKTLIKKNVDESNLKNVDESNLKNLSTEKKERFELLQSDDHNEYLTFNDLKLLNEVMPKVFKKLHATAYNVNDKKVEILNAENSGDRSCLFAVRASMAMPKLMAPVIDDETDNLLRDGGEGSNVPLEAFSNQDDYNQAEVMIFAFDKKGTADSILHDPQDKTTGLYGPAVSLFRKIVMGKRYVKNQAKDAEKIHKQGPNVVVVAHGKLGTTSFFASEEDVELAKNEAKERGAEYAKDREGQAIAIDCNSLKDCMENLTNKELKTIISAKPYTYNEKEKAFINEAVYEKNERNPT